VTKYFVYPEIYENHVPKAGIEPVKTDHDANVPQNLTEDKTIRVSGVRSQTQTAYQTSHCLQRRMNHTWDREPVYLGGLLTACVFECTPKARK
jgi:hypothetical protein